MLSYALPSSCLTLGLLQRGRRHPRLVIAALIASNLSLTYAESLYPNTSIVNPGERDELQKHARRDEQCAVSYETNHTRHLCGRTLRNTSSSGSYSRDDCLNLCSGSCCQLVVSIVPAIARSENRGHKGAFGAVRAQPPPLWLWMLWVTQLLTRRLLNRCRPVGKK